MIGVSEVIRIISEGTMEGRARGHTMEGNQTDEYIHRQAQGSAIATGIEGPRGRNLDVGVSARYLTQIFGSEKGEDRIPKRCSPWSRDWLYVVTLRQQTNLPVSYTIQYSREPN